ncbi:MAG TPA: PIN domain-containing protein, partial [Blastocatellia bacterium]
MTITLTLAPELEFKLKQEADRRRQWVESLTSDGVQVILPEIADYELRRELLRVKKKRGLAHLEHLISQIKYLPITTSAMRQAAAFLAQARQQGQPTAGDKTIDCDMILAAQAFTLGVT